ncbi:sigma-70 family RNA polymerase sigma factor [Sphingomonadaceae bacterium jetA1]|jgi:RNA polymerase sigma-70 factor (ECF subfamily)|uniref:RNA polymerase sigma factor n=1 Tax=Facivitalis istanbulensis TaxID=3075838 RepID=UPI00347FF785
MDEERDAIALWVAREILPCERSVRLWLARRWRGVVDVDDVIQEAYCRLSSLNSVAHITNPPAYFRRTVHAVATDAARQTYGKKVIPMTEFDFSNVLDEGPSADRAIAASQELGRVHALLSKMSETCRRVIVLRRIEGLSQKETASRLGVSEHVVENHIARGLKRMLNEIAEQDGPQIDEEDRLIGTPRSH